MIFPIARNNEKIYIFYKEKRKKKSGAKPEWATAQLSLRLGWEQGAQAGHATHKHSAGAGRTAAGRTGAGRAGVGRAGAGRAGAGRAGAQALGAGA